MDAAVNPNVAVLGKSSGDALTLDPLNAAYDKWMVFAAFSGENSKFDVNAELNVTAFTYLTGIAKRDRFKDLDMMLGFFVEAGFGGYDSSLREIRGEGSTKFFGGGVLTRLNFASGFYLDTSLRMGSVSFDYKSKDIDAAFETSMPYYGAHAGIGYTYNYINNNSIDVYARMLYLTETGGKDVSLQTGEEMHLDSLASMKGRTGVKFWFNEEESHAGSIRFFIGGGYEHEFRGEVPSLSADNDDPPSLKGGTSFAEAGFSGVSGSKNWLFDVGVTGYSGVKKGVSGRLIVKYVFGRDEATPPRIVATQANEERRVVVEIETEKLYFDTGKAILKGTDEEKRDVVEKVKEELAKNPDLFVLIIGHTDATGSAKINKKLSELRADSMISLLERGGIPKKKLEKIVKSNSAPVASNATNAGRSENRRVEIVIVERGKKS
jgi:outer membrane protein OmpA-like peptidoglycan-associated protein